MNWFGDQRGEDIDFFILSIGITRALTVLGGSRRSVDSKFSARN